MEFIRTWGRRLVLSLQFLTRIPIKRNLDIRDDDLPAATVYFPLIGLLVGVFSLLCTLAAGLLTQSYWLAAAVAVAGGTMFTGGLHLDGLADTCDGVFSGRPRERALEIMRDSRVGAFGVMGIAFVALIKTVTLAELLDSGSILSVWALVLAPMAGRMGIVAAAAAGKPARSDGSGRLFLEGVVTWHFVVALVFSLILSFIAMGAAGAVFVLAVLAAAGLTAWLLSRRLGGLTGDCLGAVNEIGEIVALVTLLAFVANGRFY